MRFRRTEELRESSFFRGRVIRVYQQNSNEKIILIFLGLCGRLHRVPSARIADVRQASGRLLGWRLRMRTLELLDKVLMETTIVF